MYDCFIREYVADLVVNGFVGGYYPDWCIEYSGINKDDISEYSLQYIAEYIRKGFIHGEIYDDIKSGWWKLTID